MSVEALKENVLAFYTNRHAQHRKPQRGERLLFDVAFAEEAYDLAGI